MKDKETDFQTEDLSKIVTKLIAGVGIAMSVYHLYTGYFGAPEALLHRAVHLFFTMTLIFFLFPISKKDWAKKYRWTDGLPMLLTWVSIGYLFYNYDYVITRYALVHPLSLADMTFGILLIVLLMEAARRVIGAALPITARAAKSAA